MPRRGATPGRFFFFFAPSGAASAVALAGGCGKKEEGGGKTHIRVGVVAKSLGNGFFDAVNKGAQEAAKDLGGVEIIYTGPTSTTAEGQIEVINSLIAQGVDAIAISANDPDAVVPALKKAAQRGIKVISWDSGVAPEGRILQLNPSSNALIGKMCLQLAASLYPSGDPVRDAPQLRLISRFRSRLHRSLRWRVEVPVPIAGDLRSGDGLVAGVDWNALVEAETHLGDVQLIERRSSAKQRDLGATRLILVVADTRHNREVIRLHEELRERFPIDARAGLRRLGNGEDPGGDCLLVL